MLVRVLFYRRVTFLNSRFTRNMSGFKVHTFGLMWLVIWSGFIYMKVQGFGVSDPAAAVSYSMGELYSIWDTMANCGHPRFDLPLELK